MDTTALKEAISVMKQAELDLDKAIEKVGLAKVERNAALARFETAIKRVQGEANELRPPHLPRTLAVKTRYDGR